MVLTGTVFNSDLFDTPGSWAYDTFKLDMCVFPINSKLTFPPVQSHLSQYQGCSPLHSVIHKINILSYIPVIIFRSIEKNLNIF